MRWSASRQQKLTGFMSQYLLEQHSNCYLTIFLSKQLVLGDTSSCTTYSQISTSLTYLSQNVQLGKYLPKPSTHCSRSQTPEHSLRYKLGGLSCYIGMFRSQVQTTQINASFLCQELLDAYRRADQKRSGGCLSGVSPAMPRIPLEECHIGKGRSCISDETRKKVYRDLAAETQPILKLTEPHISHVTLH